MTAAAFHELVAGRPDWQQLDERDRLIDQAHAGYRSSRDHARNLELVGWTPARRAAAVHGEAILVDPDDVDQRGPVLNLDKDKVAGQLTPWAEFLGLHGEVNSDRTQLLGRIHAEVASQAVEREREILDSVPTMQVRQLATAASELASLVRTLAACRAAAGILSRQGALREDVTALDVYLASAEKVAGGEATLLAPVLSPRRSVVTGTQGLRRDEPAKASPLPPAGVVLRG